MEVSGRRAQRRPAGGEAFDDALPLTRCPLGPALGGKAPPGSLEGSVGDKRTEQGSPLGSDALTCGDRVTQV